MRCRSGRYWVLLGLVSGCARVAPPAYDDFVPRTIACRIDKSVGMGEVHEVVQCLIGRELSADGAIQIALLNNPNVQAVFEELGIAKADWIESGLLTNPIFSIESRFPPIGGLYTNIEYLITTSLLDVFLIPLRTRLAQTEYEQVRLRVAHEILNLAFDVRQTYYELVTEKKRVGYLQNIRELADILNGISSQQCAVANINILEYQQTQAHLLEAEIALAKAQNEVIRLKEKMNRLLGLCQDVCLLIPDRMPDIDYCGFDLCALESIALEERLDLQVARWEVTRLYQKLGLKQWWNFTGLQGGVAGERELSGINALGVGFAGALPIFNYGQADRMRLCALARQATDRLAEMEVEVLSQVREAHKLLMNSVRIIQDYQLHLLPIQDAIVHSSESLYNVMGLGIDELLENKRQEVMAVQNYTEMLKMYLVARVELDRALGGYLSLLTGCYP